MKWFALLLVIALIGGSWFMFARSGDKLNQLERRVDMLVETGDADSEIPHLNREIQSLETSRTLNGVFLALGGSVFLGVLFSTFVLPNWASRVSQSIYGSNAELDEPAVLHEARVLVAKGEYEEAIAAFRKAAAEDSANRLPWTEIARIQSQHLDQPREAVATLQDALRSRDWPEDDRAFFLFRIAELCNEEASGKEQAVAALQQVIREFPESRHAMNARHRLKEWGIG